MEEATFWGVATCHNVRCFFVSFLLRAMVERMEATLRQDGKLRKNEDEEKLGKSRSLPKVEAISNNSRHSLFLSSMFRSAIFLSTPAQIEVFF